MNIDNSQNREQGKPLLDWGLERLAFPQPTFELTNLQPPRQQGLFQEVLNGDPTQLLPYVETRKDMLDASILLHALLAGTRSLDSLHPEERMLLDQATAEMLTAPPMKRKVGRPGDHVRREMDRRASQREQTGGGDPLPTPDAFWWL